MWTVGNLQPDIVLNSAMEQSHGSRNFRSAQPHQRSKQIYVAASDAAKEVLWLGRLAHTFRQVDSDSAPIVYNDNQGVAALSKNLVHHNASKHIDVRYHFVQDCVISGKIGLEKISTTDNVADAMTKCLSADRFRSLRQQMGVTANRSG